jgi:hypothetical protein
MGSGQQQQHLHHQQQQQQKGAKTKNRPNAGKNNLSPEEE